MLKKRFLNLIVSLLLLLYLSVTESNDESVKKNDTSELEIEIIQRNFVNPNYDTRVPTALPATKATATQIKSTEISKIQNETQSTARPIEKNNSSESSRHNNSAPKNEENMDILSKPDSTKKNTTEKKIMPRDNHVNKSTKYIKSEEIKRNKDVITENITCTSELSSDCIISKHSLLQSETLEKKTVRNKKPKNPSRARKMIGPEPKPIKMRNVDPPPPTLVGPKGKDEGTIPTCDEYTKTSRFNPYSILDNKWFAFYQWASEAAPLVVEFIYLKSREMQKIRDHVDKQVITEIDWSARHVLMVDLVHNQTAVLVERGDRGQYWLLPYVTVTKEKVQPLEVRFKQTGDNKYLGFFICHDARAYILSRMKDIPRRKRIQEEAAKMGWWMRGGQSYLYQGHKWMPIEEMDEEEYWSPSFVNSDDDLPPPPPEEDDDPENEKIYLFNKVY